MHTRENWSLLVSFRLLVLLRGPVHAIPAAEEHVLRHDGDLRAYLATHIHFCRHTRCACGAPRRHRVAKELSEGAVVMAASYSGRVVVHALRNLQQAPQDGGRRLVVQLLHLRRRHELVHQARDEEDRHLQLRNELQRVPPDAEHEGLQRRQERHHDVHHLADACEGILHNDQAHVIRPRMGKMQGHSASQTPAKHANLQRVDPALRPQGVQARFRIFLQPVLAGHTFAEPSITS
eukprot:scaffold310_cov307-Pinguiococcus_pyrenoidosus.AAC.14